MNEKRKKIATKITTGTKNSVYFKFLLILLVTIIPSSIKLPILSKNLFDCATPKKNQNYYGNFQIFLLKIAEKTTKILTIL